MKSDQGAAAGTEGEDPENENFFVGIGAQKAATSWLVDYLKGHPQVGFSPIKELHYFDAEYCPDHCGSYHGKMVSRLAKTASTAPIDPSGETMRKLTMLALQGANDGRPPSIQDLFRKSQRPPTSHSGRNYAILFDDGRGGLCGDKSHDTRRQIYFYFAGPPHSLYVANSV